MKKKKIIIILLIVAISIPINLTLSKYIANFTRNYIVETEQFYFNSDKLTEDGVTYNINNWSGVGTFDIQFSVDNYKNNELKSDSDIAYKIFVECEDDVTCSMNGSIGNELSSTGILYRQEESASADNYTITVTPLSAFNDNETTSVNIRAISTSPYEKEISATFVIAVGKRGVSYEIRDEENQPYFDLSITNAREEYKVITAFGTHSVGETLTLIEYEELSPEDKAKCTSAQITLSFDPHYIYADTTSSIVETSTKGYTTITEKINGVNNNVSYVSSLSFNMDASSGMSIRFYKKNSNANYTWPYGTSTSIVTFTAN